MVEEFNKNVYDIIIASDEKEILGNEEKADEEKEDDDDVEMKEKNEDGEGEGLRPKKKRKASKGDREYGVSRGNYCARVAILEKR